MNKIDSVFSRSINTNFNKLCMEKALITSDGLQGDDSHRCINPFTPEYLKWTPYL